MKEKKKQQRMKMTKKKTTNLKKYEEGKGRIQTNKKMNDNDHDQVEEMAKWNMSREEAKWNKSRE